MPPHARVEPGVRTTALATIIAALAALATAGCGGRQNAPTHADPAERPPLPPSSGTPIGLLVDEAGRLSLRSDQLDALRAIDESLSARNDALDADQRGGPSPSPRPPGLGGRRHGHHRGPRGPGGGGRPPGMHGGGDPAAAGRASDERTANIRDAIERAMTVLDPQQRQIARQLLDQHGVALAPASQTSAPAVPGEPDDASGSDESDEPDAPAPPAEM